MDDRFWQLKESAKWSLDLDEKRRAISELASSYGKEAIQAISEIKDVTAFGEIKNACIEAIKSANTGKNSGKKNHRPKVKSSKKAGKGKKKRNS